jgi:hypothetical protein
MNATKLFFSRTPRNYTTKTGYIVPTRGGELIDATLFLYNNGICIVQMNSTDFKYEATRKDISTFTLKSPEGVYEKFIITE